MGHPICRNCNGSGHKYIETHQGTKRVDCRACNGVGLNYNLLAAPCDKCGNEIVYKPGSNIPSYCRDCKEKIRIEKDNTRREKELERAKKAAQWQEKKCNECSGTIRYNIAWSNIPNLCQSCKERKIKQAAVNKAQWKTKPCIKCGQEIKYHVEWSNISNICKKCKNEQNKNLSTSCSNCGTTFEYPAHYNHPPTVCIKCKERREYRRESNQSQNSRFNAACKAARLTPEQKYNFSDYLHNLPSIDVTRLSFEELKRMALEFIN